MQKLKLLFPLRRVSVASSASEQNLFQKMSKTLRPKFDRWMTSYEEFIGVKQVKEAHSRVLQAETDFMAAQEERRKAQILMNSMQARLREVRADLDRTPRGDNNYLELIKREIQLTKDFESEVSKFEREERRERDLFHSLSSALRFSHEKERLQTEKTKYWSILASLIGACLGIIATTINSQLKLRQLRVLMAETTEESASAVIRKLEQVTSTKGLDSGAVLVQLKDLRETISASQVPNSAPIPSETALYSQLSELLVQSENARRQRELFYAAASILLIPILIFTFSIR